MNVSKLFEEPKVDLLEDKISFPNGPQGVPTCRLRVRKEEGSRVFFIIEQMVKEEEGPFQ